MMNSCSSDVNVSEILKLTDEVIQPEPQYNVVSKYLANVCDERRDYNQAIVHLTNSHGVYLKNEIKLLSDMRKYYVSDESKIAPVLDKSHFEPYSDFSHILDVVKSLPEEWTVIQITKKYTPVDVLKYQNSQSHMGLFITKFPCGKLAERINPYYVTTTSNGNSDENLMEMLNESIKIRTQYYVSRSYCKKLKEDYMRTEDNLMKFHCEVDMCWLQEWRCLFGGRLKDKTLEKETIQQVLEALRKFMRKTQKKAKWSEESFDMIYQATLHAHLMKNKDISKVLNHALYNGELDRLNSLIPLVEALKLINLGNTCAVKNAARDPVILIIDNAFELIGWEMLPPLVGQPVSRILSLHLLYAVYKYHEKSIVNGYKRIKVDSAYCLINPSSDLITCEKEMTQFIKTHMPWMKSEVGKAPDSKALVSKFKDHNIYLYCGHGSGIQYVKSNDFKKTPVKGMVMLFGCSSNLPKNLGGRTPYYNNTYTFLINGCPCLIGCIYSIMSNDADTACKEILSSLLPSVKRTDYEMAVIMPRDTNVLKAVASGKMSCTKYWSRSAFVVRGIPCKTVEGACCDDLHL